MPKHCAALPGAANELLGSSTAELATALLERLGAAIPAPRDRRSRHAALLHVTPPYAPHTAPSRGALPRGALSRGALSRGVLSPTAVTRAAAARAEALARAATRAERALRHRAPSRPVLVSMSVTAVTAVGAAAAITATGGFAALAPSTPTRSQPVTAAAALTLLGTSSATSTIPTAAPAPITAPIVTAVHAADLPTVQVPKIVSEATATAKALATREQAARTAAARRTAATAAPTHAPASKAPSAHAPQKAAAGSGVGAAAVSAAMTKLGKPYVWGAVGPNSFDCSGLVVWAFQQAGVSLPRTSSAQSTAGTAVAKGDLQPGDLVFFYSPVSHVGIYIGGGKIINATESGEPVQVTNMAYLPFHNARRV